MATAEELRAEFMRYMDAEGLLYTVMDEDDNIVYIAFGGDAKETFVMVDFDEEGNDASSVHFTSLGFAKVESANTAAAYVAVNNLNRKYRWVTFFMNDENAICAKCDAKIFPGTAGEECFEIVLRMTSILRDALDDLQGVAYLDENAKKILDLMAALKDKEAGK